MQESTAPKLSEVLAVTEPLVFVAGERRVKSGIDSIWSSPQHTADCRPAHRFASTGLAHARRSSIVRGQYPTDAGVSPSC